MKKPVSIFNSQFSILNYKGFSLIELLVVISIMVTLLTIGVASYNGFAASSGLDGANRQLKANLRLAQSFALNGEKLASPPAPSCPDGTFGGYYIILQKNAPTNTSYGLGQYCTGNGLATPRTPPSPINLPTGIKIQNLTLKTNSYSQVTILFQSLKGVTFYTCASPPLVPCFTLGGSSGPLVVTIQQGTATKSISVTTDGKIE